MRSFATTFHKEARVEARQSLASAFDGRHAMLIQSGIVALYKDTKSGQQSLVALRYPGDFIGPHETAYRVQAVTRSTVLTSSEDEFRAALKGNAKLQTYVFSSFLRAQLIAYEWLMRDSFQTPARVAHFLSEYAERTGGRNARGIQLALSQSHIAEATSQTAVNVNRVIKSLERDGLLRSVGVRSYEAKWSDLAHLGHFDPRYLERVELSD